MKFKTGVIVGAAAGYVLGTRAGRQRYDQIRRLAARLSKHPAVHQLGEQAVALVNLGRRAVAEGLSSGSRALRQAGEEPSV